MQDRWYSDNRDLVKWASLVYLAQESRATTILQVAFYRPERQDWKLLKDGRPVAFTPIVQEHFPRSLRDIERLESKAGVEIKVYDSLWPGGSREQYIQGVVHALQRLGARRLIVFLDPDTGIALGKRAPNHVWPSEVADVFKALKPKDWLVLYQHRLLFRGDWVEITQKQFAEAVWITKQTDQAVHTFSCDLAKDVALFALERKQNK